jgi:hypothetical protein
VTAATATKAKIVADRVAEDPDEAWGATRSPANLAQLRKDLEKIVARLTDAKKASS